MSRRGTGVKGDKIELVGGAIAGGGTITCGTTLSSCHARSDSGSKAVCTVEISVAATDPWKLLSQINSVNSTARMSDIMRFNFRLILRCIPSILMIDLQNEFAVEAFVGCIAERKDKGGTDGCPLADNKGIPQSQVQYIDPVGHITNRDIASQSQR